jgi:hypothetical protein
MDKFDFSSLSQNLDILHAIECLKSRLPIFGLRARPKCSLITYLYFVRFHKKEARIASFSFVQMIGSGIHFETFPFKFIYRMMEFQRCTIFAFLFTFLKAFHHRDGRAFSSTNTVVKIFIATVDVGEDQINEYLG